MKKFTLLMSALMLAAGAFAQVPEGKFIIAASASGARDHGKYMAVTAEGRLITTNTIDSNALWEGAYTEDYQQAIANVGVTGFLYEGTQDRNITLSTAPKAVAVMESPVMPGAYGITTNLEADPTSNYINFLNAMNYNTETENGGICLWALDAGSSFFFLAYDPEETEEQISAKVDELVNMATAKANAKASVEGYMNASWAGRSMGESAMWSIDYAETEEELTAATHNAMQAAITFAEYSLEHGTTLYNIRANEVITYTGNETTPIERTTAASIQSLWVAEPVDGDPIEVDGYSFKSFYLRNVATGKYVGKANDANSVLGAADTKEEAGTMNLVMGTWNNNGNNVKSFELIINNNGQARQYLNVSTNPGDTKLTLYAWDNDGGAFFKFNQLPTFESDLIPSIIGVGETDNGEFRSLDAIEVCVPVGATLTGIGSVLLTQKAWNEDFSELITDTIAQWSSEDLAKITPAVKNVDITWAFTTESVEAQVYTLPLAEPITAVGAYQASVSAYAFSNTIDEETKYYNGFNKTFDISEPKALEPITVTPAAGKVESIDLITIDPDGAGEWMVGESVGNITVTYNGEITTDANGTKLDLNGDAIAEYDTFDWETWTGGGWEIPVNFTAEGQYILTIPAGFFQNMVGDANEETIVEWTIGDLSGIKEITSLKINGKAYDLNGRAVANPTRGLFIINGQKVIK